MIALNVIGNLNGSLLENVREQHDRVSVIYLHGSVRASKAA